MLGKEVFKLKNKEKGIKSTPALGAVFTLHVLERKQDYCTSQLDLKLCPVGLKRVENSSRNWGLEVYSNIIIKEA